MNDEKWQKKRRELAVSKGLIKDKDYSSYRKVLNLYKKGFEELLNQRLKFLELDKKIEDSNLYFSPSTSWLKVIEKSNIRSKYFYCLNQFYVEKLDIKYLDILKDKDSVDQEVLDIISSTCKDVLKRDGVKTVTYLPTLPDRIVNNGSIVLELVYGRNSESLTDDEFIINLKKQREFLNAFKVEIQNSIKNNFNIEGVVFTSKMV